MSATRGWSRPRENTARVAEVSNTIRRHHSGYPRLSPIDPPYPYVCEHDAVPSYGIRGGLEGRTRRERKRSRANGVVPWGEVASLAVRAVTYCVDDGVQHSMDVIELSSEDARLVGSFLLTRQEGGLYSATLDTRDVINESEVQLTGLESDLVDYGVERSMATAFNVRRDVNLPVLFRCGAPDN